MKNLFIITLTVILITSCGKKETKSIEDLVANGTLLELKERKKELSTKLSEINNKLETVNKTIAQKDTSKKLPLITTIRLKEESFNHYIEIQGDVKTKKNILIYPEMPGILNKVYVKEGQRVVKGQLLASIDDGGMSSQIAQVEATLALAKTTFERQKRLWDQEIGSEIQFLQAKTNYEAQKNTLEQLKKQQGKASVRAPFSGVIDNVMKEAGTVVAPGIGSEIFRIVNLNNMYVEAEVSERYITSVTKNKEVKVLFPVLGTEIVSKINQVGSFINPENRSFKIEVPVANKKGNIKPNLTARLQINDYTSDKAILIPQNIISENANGDQFVYVIKDKKTNNEAVTERVIITTGKTKGDFIEVLENLTIGAEVIQEGARTVKNGQEVKVINK